MSTVKFDLDKLGGEFKILNATNGGPWHTRHTNAHFRSNFKDYKAANFRYSRNHDSAYDSTYGGRFSHDISNIFPNFDADPTDPASYDFACTDESILCTLEAGVETFFRLGQSIEHYIKKYFTLPPKDFKKWAVICEHIIRHYNEGWANGYKLGIKYWEIWNEPNLDPDDATDKRCWGGTTEQFYDLYEITAKHLKEKFPELKIGGPSFAHRVFEWAEGFVTEMAKRSVKMDFFSWHAYTADVAVITQRAQMIRDLLDANGYKDTESILNEWNFSRGKTVPFIRTVEGVHGVIGAAFVMSAIAAAEKTSIDMMMYYDTRHSVFNGVFDYYSYAPLPSYYSLKWYGDFYGYEVVRAQNEVENIYTLAGVKDGKVQAVVTYYSPSEGLDDVLVELDFSKDARYEMYVVDDDHNGELVANITETKFKMKQNTIVKIIEI